MAKTSSDDKGRLNIYVSREFWRRVKLAAAAHDLSVSQFCTDAIEARLSGSPADASGSRAGGRDGETPVDKARRFQAAHFGRSTLRVSTADLLRAFREDSGER